MNKSFLSLCMALPMAVGLVACGDDDSPASASADIPSSTSTNGQESGSYALPDTVQTLDSLLNEYKCRESYKCAHVYLVEADNIMECTGTAWAYLSEYIPSVCGYDMSESSSSETVESPVALSSASEGSEACYEGGANITLTSVENLNMTCASSTEGWTIYDSDHWILYTCNSGTWLEETVPPCVNSTDSEVTVVELELDYGTMTDARDGQTYKTIVIGDQTWMAENLNFYKSDDGTLVLDSSFCYDDSPANCEKYGRLYQEFDADKACPEGWKMPTGDDWYTLERKVEELFPDKNLNEVMRATTGWDDTFVSNNATGFSAKAAGMRDGRGNYSEEEEKTYFWGESSMLFYAWMLSRNYELSKQSMIYNYYAYSLRCIKE